MINYPLGWCPPSTGATNAPLCRIMQRKEVVGMYALYAPELVDIHIDPKFREAIRGDPVRSRIFDTATIGHNMWSLASYNEVARVVANCPDPKSLLWAELPEVYDTSGYLV